jgi:hypothetical protein
VSVLQSDPNATVSPPSQASRFRDSDDASVSISKSDPNATVSPPSEAARHGDSNDAAVSISRSDPNATVSLPSEASRYSDRNTALGDNVESLVPKPGEDGDALALKPGFHAAGDSSGEGAIPLRERQRLDRQRDKHRQWLAWKRKPVLQWERDREDEHTQHLRRLQHSIQNPMERYRAITEAIRAFSDSANNGPNAADYSQRPQGLQNVQNPRDRGYAATEAERAIPGIVNGLNETDPMQRQQVQTILNPRELRRAAAEAQRAAEAEHAARDA